MKRKITPVQESRLYLGAKIAGDQTTAHGEINSTLAMLHELGLHGMAAGLASFGAGSPLRYSECAEWLCQLLKQEQDMRQKKRYERRLRAAKMGSSGSFEDANQLEAHGLDIAFLRNLLAGEWIRAAQNILVIGPAGVGKTWLAYLLGHQALTDGYSVLYYRASRLFEGLSSARADGEHNRMLRTIARLDVLIIDDWGFERLEEAQRLDLLGVVQDRFESRSTIIISQLPVDKWYRVIGDPTIAVAVFDRLVYNAHRIELTGESRRKQWRIVRA